jgi:segregation and condensation protein B
MTNQKEKEEAQKLKALRKELEEKIEDQLPAEMLSNDHIRVEVQQVNDEEVLDPVRAKQVIEALLFASSKPLSVAEIRKVVKALTPGQIAGVLSELRAEYVRDGRSFELLEIANGYEIATRKEFAPWLMKMELQRKIKQVTQSALETLSILAYKQPVTRAEIEELRGVDVSAVLNTLVERNFIRIVGKKEVPGRPFLYGTTEKFLEHFGLKSIQDLPSIDEIRNLVENSVKKEELLGTQNIVEIPAEETAAPVEATAENAEAVAAPAEEGNAQGADPGAAEPVKSTGEGSPS